MKERAPMTPEQLEASLKKQADALAHEQLVANEIAVAVVAFGFAIAYRSAHGDTVVEDSLIWKDARSFIEAGKLELRVDFIREMAKT
jgi:hypothetical protein